MGASSLVSLFEIFLGVLKKIIGKPKSQETKINTGLNEDASAFIRILEKINSKITSTTNITWSSIESVEVFKSEINKDIIAISKGDFSSISTYDTYFLPTGDFQEISISNGWGEEYITLAKEFETLYARIN
ncbi:MAG: hypothetical protein KUG68_00250 [Flavobacteriaceae bacterium]|nr:hypothetical protein [Flavobacteriaceae bacterium]